MLRSARRPAIPGRAGLGLRPERGLAVPGPLGALVPELRRGTVVTVGNAGPAGTAGNAGSAGCRGGPGAGATTVALHLAAAATGAGEWAAALDPAGSLGGLAAREAGVDLGRFAVVRAVPPARWAAVIAALLDGVALVLAATPPYVQPADARRLAARARERATVLVVLAAGAPWPVEAELRVTAEASRWEGLERGSGLLVDRTVQLGVEGRGARSRPSTSAIALTG